MVEVRNPAVRKWVVCAAVNEAEYEEINRLAANQGITRSTLIRDWILRDLWEEHVDRMRNPNPYTW